MFFCVLKRVLRVFILCFAKMKNANIILIMFLVILNDSSKDFHEHLILLSQLAI